MSHKTNKFSKNYYEIIIGLFVTTLIVSNIASVKIISVHGIVFDAGTILFPLAYILGDIITEIYGFKKLKQLLYIGIAMLLVTFGVLYVVQLLPALDTQAQQAYTTILGPLWRIIVASRTAIFFGELLNSYILAKLKIKYQGKRLWGRLVGSTTIGSLTDTIIFSAIAFAGTINSKDLMNLILTVFCIKMLTELVLSPITVKIIGYMKRTSGTDIYEEPELRL